MFLFDSTRIYGLSVQPSLILLQKTLIHIEGMGRQIYPELDFWSIAEPYIDNWIMEKYHPSKIVKIIKEDKPKKVAEIKTPSSNLKKTVKKVAKNDVGLMPSSNYPGARNTSGYAPRVYNGLMPSSTYPGFSGSRVNLIE